MAAQPINKPSVGIEQNIEGLLCYVLGQITGIIFLIIEKENQFVQFHTLRSIVVFSAFTVVNLIIGWIPLVGWIIAWILGAAAFILWIVLMYKAYRGELYKLPVAGNIAEQQSKPNVQK